MKKKAADQAKKERDRKSKLDPPRAEDIKLKKYPKAAKLELLSFHTNEGGEKLRSSTTLDVKHLRKWEKFLHGSYGIGLNKFGVHVTPTIFPWAVFEKGDPSWCRLEMSTQFALKDHPMCIDIRLTTSSVVYEMQFDLGQAKALGKFLRVSGFKRTYQRLLTKLEQTEITHDKQIESLNRQLGLSRNMKAIFHSAVKAAQKKGS